MLGKLPTQGKSEHALLAGIQPAKRATLETGLYLKHAGKKMKVTKTAPFLVKSRYSTENSRWPKRICFSGLAVTDYTLFFVEI